MNHSLTRVTKEIAIVTGMLFSANAFFRKFQQRMFAGEFHFPNHRCKPIAMEMNLSETAFVERTETPGVFGLRWFTPTLEIWSLRHATLAFFILECLSRLGLRRSNHSISKPWVGLRVKKDPDFSYHATFPLNSLLRTFIFFLRIVFLEEKILRAAQFEEIGSLNFQWEEVKKAWCADFWFARKAQWGRD